MPDAGHRGLPPMAPMAIWWDRIAQCAETASPRRLTANWLALRRERPGAADLLQLRCMTKHAAMKFTVDVGADRTVRLPDGVPLGPVELIVLVNTNAEQPPSPIGLFKDDGAILDEAMDHARELREHSQPRPLP